ncbi:PhnA domain-containing protein [Halosquirtibacter laminarini]|uniref:PhnA domain-containing protein n=1 Tax=Halosquirtibacter laminarini TaxID=3374600 RepID=A0AC61NND2_9BACT|nr:PhnA domain-containing protein [Prolixibacteraceae bacterium]
MDQILITRSENKCELCGATENLSSYQVPPVKENNSDKAVYICDTCKNQIEGNTDLDANHWRCLNDSMWSQVPAVQVMVWRILNRIKAEVWPQDLLDMMYMDEETLQWAKATGEDQQNEEGAVKHIDSNGATLTDGDTVTLIKDLNVKGAGFTAKRGTAVRNISLVQDNPEHIEGKVSGQHIVILTKFVKKQ